MSLAFTFVGAAVFSSIHSSNKARIPQEAIIGICYAVASAAAIVAMSKSTSGGPSTCRTCSLATSWPCHGMTS